MQHHLDILPRALANEIHRHHGRGGHRLLQVPDDVRQRLFEFLLVQHHLMVTPAQQRCGLRRIHQFIVRELLAVTDEVTKKVCLG